MAFFQNIFNFIDPIESGVHENKTPDDMELPMGWTKELLEEISDIKRFISERNSTGAYLVPIDEDRVILNMLPQKKQIYDGNLQKVVDHKFDFFADVDYERDLEPTMTLPEGEFFRIANEGIKPIEEYQYYSILDGRIASIPNFKTLEVMLAERNKNYSSVRVIEVKDFEMLDKASQQGNASGGAIDTSDMPDDAAAAIQQSNGGGSTSIPDKSSEWTEDMKQKSAAESFEELAKTAESAEQLASEATEAAQSNIDAAVADADAARAEAEAATVEAQAAIAAAEAESENQED